MNKSNKTINKSSKNEDIEYQEEKYSSDVFYIILINNFKD